MTDAPVRAPVPVSVVVPARNAERWITSCLRSVRAAGAAEVIVVDGRSTDATVELSRDLADRIVSDDGAGVAAARQLGVSLATHDWVLLVDTDVVLPRGAVERLVAEAVERGLVGLQAGLRSVGEGDYWSEALAEHHNRGFVRGWFGVCATLVRRDLLLRYPLDSTFVSGEDVDLRLRLEAAGEPVGVSRDVVVLHRFAPGFDYSRDQFLADGAGLGRLVRRHGRGAVPRALLPFGAAGLGVLRLSSARLIPYWVALAIYNAVGLVEGLLDDRVRAAGASRTSWERAELGIVSVRAVLALLVAGLVGAGAGIAIDASGALPDLGATVLGSPLPGLLTATVAILLVTAEVSGATARPRTGAARAAVDLALVGAFAVLVLGGIRFAQVVGLIA